MHDVAGGAKGRNWTRKETLAAFNLYSRTSFGRLHARNPQIVRLAGCLGRTPSAVAMKCCNLASLDPALQAKGISGLAKVSHLDRQVWSQFNASPETIGYESEVAFSEILGRPVRMIPPNDPLGIIGETDREAIRRVRVTQHLFRAIIMTSYSRRCAICTLSVRELLVASHIVGWAIDKSNRMNPRNGICLCAFHDRAFDAGIIDIDEAFVIHVTAKCRVDTAHRVAKDMLYRFEDASIELPQRWQPDPTLLQRRRCELGLAG